MKDAACCPRCEARKFFVVSRVRTPDQRYSSTTSFHDVTLTGTDNTNAVRLEAWVCSSCGYTELYAKALHLLAQMAEQRVGAVRVVDKTADAGRSTPG